MIPTVVISRRNKMNAYYRDNDNSYHRELMLKRVISKYGMEYVYNLEYDKLDELIKQEARSNGYDF